MMKEVEREESAKFSDRKPAASSEETVAVKESTEAVTADAELVAEAEVIAEMEVVAEADAAVSEEEVK